MTLQVKNKYLIVGLFIALCGLFIFGLYIGRRKANNASTSLITALTGKITTYEYKLDSLTKYASERDQIIVEQKQAIESGLIQNKELKALGIKRLSEVTFLKAQIQVLLDSVAHSGDIVIVHPCGDTLAIEYPAIRLPFTFNQQNKYMALKGGFDYEGKMSIDLKVPVELDVWTGINKKTKKYIAVVTSENPYVKINDILSVKMDLPKPKRIGVGVQAGYGLILGDPLKTAPYIGVGVSYNLFRF